MVCTTRVTLFMNPLVDDRGGWRDSCRLSTEWITLPIWLLKSSSAKDSLWWTFIWDTNNVHFFFPFKEIYPYTSYPELLGINFPIMFFVLSLSLFILAVPHSLWALNSLTRDWAWALGSESMESEPLSHQGIASHHVLSKSLTIQSNHWLMKSVYNCMYGHFFSKQSKQPGLCLKFCPERTSLHPTQMSQGAAVVL